jgi:hypothetical protein
LRFELQTAFQITAVQIAEAKVYKIILFLAASAGII